MSAESSQRISYWSIVWEQLRKNRIAVFGLWCIGVLVLLAVYAPLLSLDQPLVWRDATGWSSPLLLGLFNRLLFENAVDVFFNLLMVLSPLYAAIWVLARRRVGAGRLARWLVGVHAVAFALVAPSQWGPVANPLYTSSAIVDYRELAQGLAAYCRPAPPTGWEPTKWAATSSRACSTERASHSPSAWWRWRSTW
jgi:hypothetical protein